MTVLSIQIGMPRILAWSSEADGHESSWESGIYKAPIPQANLGIDSLAGDGQADLVHHGGPDRALLLFASEHYPTWASRLGREIPSGGFGENLTTEGVSEDDVCLGDVWRTDSVEIEVSQPRLPCYKLARRLDWPELNVEVMASERAGWYARTRSPGVLRVGDAFRLVERPHPTWTIRRAFHTYVGKPQDVEALRKLSSLGQLSTLWKEGLAKRLRSDR